MTTYLCIARQDLREGPNLEIGFYQADTPEEAYRAVLANFVSHDIGHVAVYTVDNQSCVATMVFSQ